MTPAPVQTERTAPANAKGGWPHRNLTQIEGLSRRHVEWMLDRATELKSSGAASVREALRGHMLVNFFLEPSTRTRVSFEVAAKRLGVDTVYFDATSSSLAKGEALIDTVCTIRAMGVDFVVMRHGSSGACELILPHIDASVINAGDGSHEHPTQALLDALTIRDAFGEISGLNVTIVGDALHSRVARSNIHCLRTLGASVTLVGPPSLVPDEFASLGVRVARTLQDGLNDADVIYVLRIQNERLASDIAMGPREYRSLFGIDESRLAMAPPRAVVMHPGPVNRGVEIDAALLRHSRCLVLQQVANGVWVRMATLLALAGARA